MRGGESRPALQLRGHRVVGGCPADCSALRSSVAIPKAPRHHEAPRQYEGLCALHRRHMPSCAADLTVRPSVRPLRFSAYFFLPPPQDVHVRQSLSSSSFRLRHADPPHTQRATPSLSQLQRSHSLLKAGRQWIRHHHPQPPSSHRPSPVPSPTVQSPPATGMRRSSPLRTCCTPRRQPRGR